MKIIKKVDNLFNNRFFKWLIVPLFLLLVWLTLGILYTSYKSFTVIEYPHYENQNNNFFNKKLLKNQKLSGEFTAEENNLGIISLRFGKVPVVNYAKEDILIFRIKEKGQVGWISENRFRSGIIKSFSFFPFGFEPIANSAGKSYVFEIRSSRGDKYNAVATQHANPIYTTKYKFSKNEVFSSVNSLFKFVSAKVFTFFVNTDILLSSSVFLIPFVFYFVWITAGKKGLSGNVLFSSRDDKRIKTRILERNLFMVIVLALIFSDILLFENLITGLMLGLLGLWIINILLNHLSSKVTFSLAFVIILISLISMYFDWIILIDKSSAFAYFLLVIGFIQNTIEDKKKSKK